MLLLDQAPARELFNWTPTDADVRFASHITGYPDNVLTGPMENGPTSILPGHWSVGIGIGESSDVVGVPERGTLICVREFDIEPNVRSVSIHAVFDSPCTLAVDIDPAPLTDQTSDVAPAFMPPDGGIMDDCHDRRLLLRVDPDGRVWYEDVDTGQRIEVADQTWSGWTIHRNGMDVDLVSPDRKATVPEWSIEDGQCIFAAGNVAWIDGVDQAWQPWERAIG